MNISHRILTLCTSACLLTTLLGAQPAEKKSVPAARGKAGGPGRGQKGKAAEGAARDGATSGVATPKAGTPPTGGTSFGASEENLKRASKCIDILAGLPYVDTKRIAAYGNSMGAFITGVLGAKEKDRLRAAAFTAGGLSSRGGAGAEEQVNGVRVPMLILHGSTDTTVPPESSARFKQVLDRNKVPNERHVFDGVGHNLHQQKADEVNALMRAWFVKYGVLEK